MMGILVYLLLLLLQIAVPSSSEVMSLNCTMTNIVLTRDAAPNASCTAITFINVTAMGKMTINISISQLFEANRLRQPSSLLHESGSASIPIYISLTNIQLLNGSVLAVDSSGSTHVDAMSFSISILNLFAINGCLFIRGGERPLHSSSLAIVGANMTGTDDSTVPRMGTFDAYKNWLGKLLFIDSLGLDESTMLITNSTFSVGRLNGSCVPLYISGSIAVVNFSTWTISNSSFSNEVFDDWNIMFARIVVANSSTWIISSTSLRSLVTAQLVGDAIFIESSTIVIDTLSSWEFVSCVLRGGQDGIYMASSNMSITQLSQWAFDGCEFDGRRYGIFITDCVVSISANSSWKLLSSSFTGSIGLHFFNGLIVLQHDSSWFIDQCVWRSTNLAGLAIVSSDFVLDENCSWLLTSSRFVTAAYAAALAITIDSKNSSVRQRTLVTIASSSTWLMWNVSIDAFLFGSWSGMLLLNCEVVMMRGGVWNMTNTTISSNLGGLLLQNSSVHVSDSSLWLLESVVISAQLAGIALSLNSRVALSKLSVWSISRCSISGGGNSVALRSDIGSTILVTDFSSWTIISSSLTTRSRNMAAIDLVGDVAVNSSSMLILERNRLVTLSLDSASCIAIEVMSTLEFGMVRIVDNNCSAEAASSLSASSFLMFVQSVAKPRTAFPFIVVRCNAVNGAVWRHYAESILQLPCGRCNELVDCFVPLTAISTFSKTACPPSCRCEPNCGEGEKCMPGLLTRASVSTCKPTMDRTLRLFGASVSSSVAESPSHVAFTKTRSPIQGTEGLAPIRSAFQSVVVAAVSAALIGYGGGSGAFALQRMLAQEAVNDCRGSFDRIGSPLDFSSSPTQWKVGPDDKSAHLRGAVSGNVLIWIACCGLAGFAALILQIRGVAEHFRDSCALLGIPGLLYVPYSILLVPTASSSLMLLLAPAGSAGSAARNMSIGIAGLVVVLSAAASIAAVMLVPSDQFFGVATRARRRRTRTKSTGLLLHRVFRLCANSCEWSDRPRVVASVGFVQRWGNLFSPFIRRRHWFCVVETASSLVSAMLVGLASSAGENGCTEVQILSACAAFIFLLALLSLRPFGAPMDLHLAYSNAAITFLSAVLGASNVDTTALTGLQTFLNAVGMLVLVAAMAAEGSFSAAWRQLSKVRKAISSRSRMQVGCQRLTANDMLDSMTNGIPEGMSAEQRRSHALECLLNYICAAGRQK